jgi:peptidoglycan/LPS O-acetylase OafA/YrhL
MKKRFIGFDLVRGFGVIMIAVVHSDATMLNPRIGWIGLDSFFILSGFLVSGLLFAEYKSEGSIRPGRFFLRRGFKIYPLFYLVLVIHLLYFWWKNDPPAWGAVLSEVLFYQNYRPNVMVVSWSLAVEEHFYILLLLFVVYLTRAHLLTRSRILPVTCVFILLACIVTRYVTFLMYGSQGRWVNDFPSHLKMDAPALGVLLSYFYHFHHERFRSFIHRWQWPLVATGCLLLTPVLLVDQWHPFSSIGYTMIDIACGIMISLMVVNRNKNRDAGNRATSPVLQFFAFIGRCSYAIYLVHFLVGPAVANLIKSNVFPELAGIFYSLVYTTGGVVTGIFLTYLVEQPLLSYRDRKFPQPGRKQE